MAELADAVKSIGNALGAIFRHLLPGVLALSAIATARPFWFVKVDVSKAEWLVVLGVLAIVIGNVWFVLHRYVIQQIVDWFFWFCKAEGGPKRGEGYGVGIANHVWRFFSAPNVSEDIREHIRFRTSSVVLMYITAEVASVAALLAENESVLRSGRWWVLGAAIVIFAAAVWQNYLTRRIEGKVANGHA
ncbi:MAG: hypothetical protein M0Z35_15505 [Desulfitobacterium hafniense]|nr:hypothetical protein [Desulfitobacterium hafniense]